MNCRFCRTLLTHEFVDLVNSPPSNSFLRADQLNEPEVFYPLRVFVCDSCFLVQIDEHKKAGEIFSNDYLYFSSFSQSWLAHSEKYVGMMCDRFGYSESSQVIEIASNDGYLLQYFHERGIPVLGIEPTLSTAQAARAKGIETMTRFFGVDLANELRQRGITADLLLGNNVLAHVPDLNDFVAGLGIALSPTGVITMEFPHLLQLIENNQFDTIYHEHFSYLSFHSVNEIFAKHELEIFDVEELATHGGSLRIYARHRDELGHPPSTSVRSLLEKEKKTGLLDIEYYHGFQAKVESVKYELLSFLLTQKNASRKVAAYGAAAKGNTLLNYCGVRRDLLSFIIDASPYKQGLFTPAGHIPIVDISYLEKEKPDYLLVLPWNLKDEIYKQIRTDTNWTGEMLVAIPQLQFL